MPLDISRIQALCFDLDGTLNDTDDQFVLKLASWLEPVRFLFGKQGPLHFARRLVMKTETPGTYLFGLPDRLGIDEELAALGDWLYRKGLGNTHAPFKLILGVYEMLEQLYPYYPMSIVSARGARTAQLFLEQFRLQRFFQSIATAQTCRHTKPYPDPLLWVAEKMGVPATACLMIGDTTVDVRTGKAAGAQTVAVLCGFGEETELRKAGADMILSSTALLSDILLTESKSQIYT